MSEKNRKNGSEKAMGNYLYRASAADFKKIPGSPIAYWVSAMVLNLFETNKKLEDISKPRQGATTSDNNRFLRLWHEVKSDIVGMKIGSLDDAQQSEYKWFPYNKGGGFRRWYGNQYFVINYENDGEEIKAFHDELNKTRPGGRLKNQQFYFKPCVSWSKVSSGTFATRFFPGGFIFDVAGSAVFFGDEATCLFYNGLLNTSFVRYILGALSPTLNFESEHLCKIPVLSDNKLTTDLALEVISKLTRDSKCDWESYETSWDFISLPLLQTDHRQTSLKATYQKLRTHWREISLQMKRLEEENNRIFIDAYGLQDELTSEVPLKEITLTCNPHYRYSGNKSEEELEALLLADTMREFISYAVGCMFGRYALDKPGLILANQGETMDDYYKKLQTPRIDTNEHEEKEKDIRVNSCPLVVQNLFPADDDNVIPMLDGDWFTDDITERFFKFLRVTFGEEHYEENLRFIEEALGKDIRKFFLKDFYTDHVKRYKKRPIYWLFSSPKGSFNALIYMHRYRPDTVSVVLNDYLREFRTKLNAHKDHLEAVSISGSASQGEKTKALKEIEKLKKMIEEMEDYERDVLFPLATEQVEIDLDDGVKVNYNKFGKALKKIPGLSGK